MDAYETCRKDWEDLAMTKEELKTLTECLKKEEFRKLLMEYAEEVTDPENRKIYEKEITQLEKERGVDVTFVNPEPGYVIKTSVNGDRKCFLNICKSNVVAQPSSQPAFEQGQRSLQWSIPYTLIPPRDELDKKNVRCMVFDVIFHPDTIYLSSKNAGFREIVNNTAMDGVENNFKVKLDRKNPKFPKLKYKGFYLPAVIRKPSTEPPKEPLDMEPEIYQKLMAEYDENREQQLKRVKKKPKRASPPTTYYKDTLDTNIDANSKYVTPKFSIKHQSDIELEDFSTSKTAKMNATVPKRLIITVDLPLLKTAADAFLDVQERYLSIQSEKPAKYLLELPLPHSVDVDSGNAKFEPRYRKLVVTLPVIPPAVPVLDTREDSGVESDHGSPVPLLHEVTMKDSLSHSNDSMPKLVEECETVIATTKVENESENLEECSDTALWTSSIENTNTFIDPSIKYSLPAFNCNIYDDQLVITVNVKNVNPNSIRHRFLRNNLGMHVLLTSVGAGFFPQYYSLCLKIFEDSVDSESLTVEPWDNNVVFTVTLKNTENLARYYVGIDEEFMEEKDFPVAASFMSEPKQLIVMENTEPENDRTVVAQVVDNSVVRNISSSQLDSDDESTKSTQRQQSRRHAMKKARSVSESSVDELTSNSSATVSESSADENGMPASSIDSHDDSLQDINSESECSSLKKTVRFNEVVSQQLFRSKSSILGQRKKNQRKLTTVSRPVKQQETDSETCQKSTSNCDEKREQPKRAEKKPKRASPPTTCCKDALDTNADTNSKYITPKFSVKQQPDIGLEDFSASKDEKTNDTVPKKLIITIDLPLLKTATDVTLDVQERYLSMKSEKPVKYLLELPLPYCVDADSGSSKFEPKHKKLFVTLPVIPSAVPVSDTREDSGVESDHGSPVPQLDEDPTEDSLSKSHSSDSTPKLDEECETVAAATKLGNECESSEEYCDTALRTSSIENPDTFIDPSVKYSLPAFTFNLYDNQLAVTVNVKNVDPNSIRHRVLQNNLGIHISLTSVAAGYFPQYYSLCLKIHEDSVDPDSITVEPWDNNVVFTVTLKNTENLTRYYVGADEEFMEEKNFPTAASFKNQLKELTAEEDAEPERDQTVDVQAEDDGVVINIVQNQLDSDDEAGQESTKSTQRQRSRRHAATKIRSVSESSADELTSSSNTTVSESSADENEMPATSTDCHYDSMQDISSESECSSLKKTVRFNAVVSRKLFRSDSSILKRRERSQRKLTTVTQTVTRTESQIDCRTESRAVKPILKRDEQSGQQATAKDAVKAEFKNDLIFDLDM